MGLKSSLYYATTSNIIMLAQKMLHRHKIPCVSLQFQYLRYKKNRLLQQGIPTLYSEGQLISRMQILCGLLWPFKLPNQIEERQLAEYIPVESKLFSIFFFYNILPLVYVTSFSITVSTIIFSFFVGRALLQQLVTHMDLWSRLWQRWKGGLYDLEELWGGPAYQGSCGAWPYGT